MTATAVGIHAHPTLKAGLIPTDPNKPILEIDQILTGIVPPSAEDRDVGVTFGLDGNDRWGDCGPTGTDNNRRSTSKVATGTQRTAPLEGAGSVFNLYRASGNPNFDPSKEGTEDNGVEMGAMLDALMKVGLGGDKPVAFGRAKTISDVVIEQLIAVFGGTLFAVNLEVAQQSQSEGSKPEWKYENSSEWGGHCVFSGKYEKTPSGLIVPVISWDKEIATDPTFRARQLEEVWIIIWPWHLEHPAFLEGVDQTKLAAAFKELTGKALPIPTPTPTPKPAPTPPAPAPTPDPVDPPQPDPAPPMDPPAPDEPVEDEQEQALVADKDLWVVAENWAEDHRHIGETERVAKALKAWATAKGFSSE